MLLYLPNNMFVLNALLYIFLRWLESSSYALYTKRHIFKKFVFGASKNYSCKYKINDLFILFISSLFKVDLHLPYKKPINVNNNTAYISFNKLPNNIDNNETKYVIIR